MKVVKFNILMVFLALVFFGGSQIKQQPMDQKNYYPFEGKYIDLEELKFVVPAGVITENFKTTSKYAFRFSAPSEWLSNFNKAATIGQCKFTISSDNELYFKSSPTAEFEKIDALGESVKLDNVVGNDFLLPLANGVVRVSRLQEEDVYRIIKYDLTGKPIYEENIKHTEVTIDGNTYYHHPYLYYFGCTPSYMIFTSNDRVYPKTVTIALSTGIIQEYDFIIAGFIRDEDESNVPGFVDMERDGRKFTTRLLNLTWSSEMPVLSCNRAEILMMGEILYISFYHSLSTGATLFAYNRSEGNLLWKADVKQMNISHSEYYNTVHLSAWNNYIIMEGIEAEAHYVQIFNRDSGERLFSTF